MRLTIIFLFVVESLSIVMKKRKSKDEIYRRQKYTTCSNKIEHDLPILNDNEKYIFKESIFFIEPSCVGDLNTRQACSVESAAVANPKKMIYVLFVAPVPTWRLRKKPLRILIKYPNIKLLRIDVDRYVKESPIESFFSRVMEECPYPVEHLSNLLRFVTLYKYGGIYLETDVLVLKSFSWLPVRSDWVAVEDDMQHKIGSSQLAISNSSIGKRYMEQIFQLMALKIDPTLSLLDYCSDIMKRALTTICGTAMFMPEMKFKNTNCYGLAVYAQSYFYNINFRSPDVIFTPYFNISLLSQSMAVNTYNSITFDTPINVKSGYALLMNRYCPRIRQEFNVKKVVISKKNRTVVLEFRNPKANKAYRIHTGTVKEKPEISLQLRTSLTTLSKPDLYASRIHMLGPNQIYDSSVYTTIPNSIKPTPIPESNDRHLYLNESNYTSKYMKENTTAGSSTELKYIFFLDGYTTTASSLQSIELPANTKINDKIPINISTYAEIINARTLNSIGTLVIEDKIKESNISYENNTKATEITMKDLNSIKKAGNIMKKLYYLTTTEQTEYNAKKVFKVQFHNSLDDRWSKWKAFRRRLTILRDSYDYESGDTEYSDIDYDSGTNYSP